MMCVNIDAANVLNGILFIGCNEEGEKTDPGKISEWFSEEFIKSHKVYAIKEEESFLLKIYTRDREVANKVMRKKGGRKPMLMGQEVHGEIIVACGRCGYRSTEGSNVRRHLKKAVCAKDKGYLKEELDGLNRLERQKYIRKVATAKFRAKKKLEEDNEEDATEELSPGETRCRLKGRKKTRLSRALLLGPYVEKDTVSRVSFDIFTVNEHNIRCAWKPSFCHKIMKCGNKALMKCGTRRLYFAKDPEFKSSCKDLPKEMCIVCKSSGDACQIVFKGARMKRRCLDLPLPIILTYRKLDCKVHHCNFTLFHSHARKAVKEDVKAKTSIDVRMYEDTVMTQEFYHHFVALLSVMKLKASQCARYLTSVWETILMERLNSASVPEEYRKLITLSKQTVKSIWESIEEESGRKNTLLLPRSKKKKSPAAVPTSPSPPHVNPSHLNIQIPYQNLANHPPIHPPPVPDIHLQQSTQPLQHNTIHTHFHDQDYSHHSCMKRFSHPIPKPPLSGTTHPLPLPHSHTMLQAPSHPHWVSSMGQTHSAQYPPNMPYSVPPHHDDYYSVQASFVTQFASSSVGPSP